MLIAFSLLAVFVLGVFALMYYYPTATAQAFAKAASQLDAQEVLKRIVRHTGDPPNWANISEVRDFGLADATGMLDPRKIMALASVGDTSDVLQCIINPGPQQQSIDPKAYERILRSLFGNEWDRYDIELRIRPALNIKIWNESNTVHLIVDPPGVYRYDLSVVYYHQSPVSPQFMSSRGYTDKNGFASVVVPGEFLFAFAHVRGATLRGLNCTYGYPQQYGGISQRAVIMMPLTEVHFATWRRWTDRRPESLVTSYAKTVADAGEVTYVVELWVFKR